MYERFQTGHTIPNHLICVLISDETAGVRQCKTKILFVCAFIKILIVRSLESTSTAARPVNTPRADLPAECMIKVKKAAKIRNLCDDDQYIIANSRNILQSSFRPLKVV